MADTAVKQLTAAYKSITGYSEQVSGPNYIDSFDEWRSRCDCSARASFYLFSGFQVRLFD